MLQFINEIWELNFDKASGEISVVADTIGNNTPKDKWRKVASIAKPSNRRRRKRRGLLRAAENARLIALAPDMLRILCNIGGEVAYGNSSLPEELLEAIDNVIRSLRHPLEEE